MSRRSALFGSNKSMKEEAFIKNFLENNEIDYFYNTQITKIFDYKFYNCNIETVSLPNVIEIGQYSFGASLTSSLKRLFLPKLFEINTPYHYTVFQNCQNLEVLSIGTNYLVSNIFMLTKNLKHLILTYPAVVYISGGGNTWKDQIDTLLKNEVYLYVPRSVYEDYQSETYGWKSSEKIKDIRIIEDINSLYAQDIYGTATVPSFKNINNDFIKNFIENNPIENFYNSKVTKIAAYRFLDCPIKNLFLPNVTSCGAYAFSGRGSNSSAVSTLERLFLPKLKEGTGSFFGGWNIFSRNTNLKVLEIGIEEIPANSLQSCTNLKHLILTSDSEVEITLNGERKSAEYMFDNYDISPFKDGNGTVYVLETLLSNYLNSEYWEWQDSYGEPKIAFSPISSINYNTIGKEE